MICVSESTGGTIWLVQLQFVVWVEFDACWGNVCVNPERHEVHLQWRSLKHMGWWSTCSSTNTASVEVAFALGCHFTCSTFSCRTAKKKVTGCSSNNAIQKFLKAYTLKRCWQSRSAMIQTQGTGPDTNYISWVRRAASSSTKQTHVCTQQEKVMIMNILVSLYRSLSCISIEASVPDFRSREARSDPTVTTTALHQKAASTHASSVIMSNCSIKNVPPNDHPNRGINRAGGSLGYLSNIGGSQESFCTYAWSWRTINCRFGRGETLDRVLLLQGWRADAPRLQWETSHEDRRVSKLTGTNGNIFTKK